MKIKIDFPKNMITDGLIVQERIPCVCKIARNFEVCFSDTVPESSGIVEEWDRQALESRAVAGGGGEYTHYANGLITLRKIDDHYYEITDLQMFYYLYGWCYVVKNGEYAEPGKFWDEE